MDFVDISRIFQIQTSHEGRAFIEIEKNFFTAVEKKLKISQVSYYIKFESTPLPLTYRQCSLIRRKASLIRLVNGIVEEKINHIAQKAINVDEV